MHSKANDAAPIYHPLYMTSDEIAQRLGVCRGTAIELIRRELPYVRCGRLFRVRRTAFAEWEHKQEIKSNNLRR